MEQVLLKNKDFLHKINQGNISTQKERYPCKLDDGEHYIVLWIQTANHMDPHQCTTKFWIFEYI